MSLLLLGAGLCSPPDSTAPTLFLVTVAADGSTVTLTFLETVQGHTGFTLSPSDGAAVLVYTAGSGTTELLFTTSRVIGSHETLTLSYTPGDVVDLAGNALASISARVAQNDSTQDTVVPTLASVTVASDGTTVTLVFSEAVTASTGFALDAGGAVTLTYASGSGTSTLVFTAGSTIGQGDTVTLDYVPGNGVDLAGNALAPVTDRAVTNNSTQGLFSPTDIAGLVGWWQADAGTYEDVAGSTPAADADDPVGRWADQSGNGRHLTPTSDDSNRRPLLKLAVQNGLPILRYDGTDDILECAGFPEADQRTIFAVVCSRDTSDDQAIVMHQLNGSMSFGWPTTGSPGKIRLAAEGVSLDALSNYSFAQDELGVIAGRWDGSGNAVWINGAEDATHGNVLPGTPAALALGVGASRGLSQMGAVDLGEVLIYNVALTLGEMADVFAYLNARWAIY